MNEFDNYMVIREKVSLIIEALDEIEDPKERADNLDYAIKMLEELKAEQK